MAEINCNDKPTLQRYLPGILLVLVVIAFSSYFLIKRSADHADSLAVLRIGILPDDADNIIRSRYAPLLAYLSKEIGVESQLVLPSSYDELVDLFDSRELDLAYFGGLTFLQSYTNNTAEPLVMRNLDLRFTSVFFIKGNEAASDIYDFKGKVMSFGSSLSTSGHLMPRQFLQSTYQIIPEAFFSDIEYSGAHDKTVYQVRDGKAELGVANSEIITRMTKDGRLKQGDIKVVWETPPYSDYVWAVNKRLPSPVKIQLRDSFLALSREDKTQREVLSNLGANYFIPAGINDFSSLLDIATELDMVN